MRRKRQEVKLKEEIKISETCSFTIEECEEEGWFRLIEWGIREDGRKRIENIREASKRFITHCVDNDFNLLVKII